MDSDDEFDMAQQPRPQVQDFNPQELVETGSTTFTVTGQQMPRIAIDSEDEEEEFTLGANDPIRKKMNKLSPNQIKNELCEEFMAKDYSHLVERKAAENIDEMTFGEIAAYMDNVTEDGGIKKRVLVPGHGGKIQDGQVVYINYVITCEEGDETARVERVVDTTKTRGAESYRFKVGKGEVLPVIELGVKTMEPSEHAQFLATYEYAYGKLGLPGFIGAEESVMVQIAVERVEHGAMKAEIWEMDRDEREKLPFSEKLKAASELKAYGNDFFNKENFPMARGKYRKALEVLSDVLTTDERELILLTEAKYTLFINMGQSYISEAQYRKATPYLDEATKMNLPNYKKVKAYYRLALCLSETGNLDLARRHIATAKSLDSHHKTIDELYTQLQNQVRRDQETEVEYAQRMFRDLNFNPNQ